MDAQLAKYGFEIETHQKPNNGSISELVRSAPGILYLHLLGTPISKDSHSVPHINRARHREEGLKPRD